MRTFILGVSAAALIAGAASPALAQHGYDQRPSDYQHSNSNNDQHNGWAQDQGANHRWNHGDRMGYNDWSRAQPVDYRAHHLRRPPAGYAWRETNGQFILAAVATGVVASIIFDNAR